MRLPKQGNNTAKNMLHCVASHAEVISGKACALRNEYPCHAPHLCYGFTDCMLPNERFYAFYNNTSKVSTLYTLRKDKVIIWRFFLLATFDQAAPVGKSWWQACLCRSHSLLTKGTRKETKKRGNSFPVCHRLPQLTPCREGTMEGLHWPWDGSQSYHSATQQTSSMKGHLCW